MPSKAFLLLFFSLIITSLALPQQAKVQDDPNEFYELVHQLIEDIYNETNSLYYLISNKSEAALIDLETNCKDLANTSSSNVNSTVTSLISRAESALDTSNGDVSQCRALLPQVVEIPQNFSEVVITLSESTQNAGIKRFVETEENIVIFRNRATVLQGDLLGCDQNDNACIAKVATEATDLSRELQEAVLSGEFNTDQILEWSLNDFATSVGNLLIVSVGLAREVVDVIVYCAANAESRSRETTSNSVSVVLPKEIKLNDDTSDFYQVVYQLVYDIYNETYTLYYDVADKSQNALMSLEITCIEVANESSVIVNEAINNLTSKANVVLDNSTLDVSQCRSLIPQVSEKSLDFADVVNTLSNSSQTEAIAIFLLKIQKIVALRDRATRLLGELEYECYPDDDACVARISTEATHLSYDVQEAVLNNEFDADKILIELRDEFEIKVQTLVVTFEQIAREVTNVIIYCAANAEEGQETTTAQYQ